MTTCENCGTFDHGETVEFEATYKLALRPTLLFNWAQSERLGGHCSRAIEIYKRFLDSDHIAPDVAAHLPDSPGDGLVCNRGHSHHR